MGSKELLCRCQFPQQRNIMTWYNPSSAGEWYMTGKRYTLWSITQPVKETFKQSECGWKMNWCRHTSPSRHGSKHVIEVEQANEVDLLFLESVLTRTEVDNDSGLLWRFHSPTSLDDFSAPHQRCTPIRRDIEKKRLHGSGIWDENKRKKTFISLSRRDMVGTNWDVRASRTSPSCETGC